MRTMMKTRYIPQDAVAVEHPLGVVYKYERAGKPLAIAYAGKATKSAWHHSFIGRDPLAMRETRIQEFFKGLEASAAMKAEWKAKRNAPTTLVPGDVVSNSWGYEQTNVDFYQVVRATARRVWLQRLSQTSTETGFMCGTTVPVLGSAHGEVLCKSANGNNVTFTYGSASKWDGKPERYSNYA